jgi:hypothetical protein
MRKLLYLFFISSLLLGTAQNLQVTGPTEVCPGQTYTFTATTNSQGTFNFFVFEDGGWNKSFFTWDCDGEEKSATFEHTFSNTEEPVTVRAWFKRRYFCG